MAFNFTGEPSFNAVKAYGVPSDGVFAFVIEPKSFLENYLNKGLKEPLPLGDPGKQELYELMIQEQNPIPGFRVEPSRLNLDEYRRPGPAYPGEDLDRDRFLRGPQSPLSSTLSY